MQKPSKFKVKPLALPGANALVMLDYLAYDQQNERLWVSAGNTGSGDVIDTRTDEIKRVEGFPVAQVEFRGQFFRIDPSTISAMVLLVTFEFGGDFLLYGVVEAVISLCFRRKPTRWSWLTGFRRSSFWSLTYRLHDKSGVDLIDAELYEEYYSTDTCEVRHEIPSCNMGGCGLFHCEWVGGLFLCEK